MGWLNISQELLVEMLNKSKRHKYNRYLNKILLHSESLLIYFTMYKGISDHIKTKPCLLKIAIHQNK